MNYKNVNDIEHAGSPWFYVDTYKIFQEGLSKIIKEISNIEEKIKDLNLPESPYKNEKKRILHMINHAEEEYKISEKKDSDEITIRGISWGSLRYLKAAVLMMLAEQEEKKRKVINEYDYLPTTVVENINIEINRLIEISEMGLFKDIEPSGIYFSIKKIKERILSDKGNDKKKKDIEKEIDNMKWDIFISHASEDKEDIAYPLAVALASNKLRVWYDDFTLKLGDSLRRSIDKGLADSRYGIVIISNNYFSKEWPQKELDGLMSRELNGKKVILPVWHNISQQEVAKYSPMIADKVAIKTDVGIDNLVKAILETIEVKK